MFYFCLTCHFIFIRSIVIIAALWQIFSAPTPPSAASPLPLPVGLSSRIRTLARSGSGIRVGPPGTARGGVTVAMPGGT